MTTEKKKGFYIKYIQPHMGLSIWITIIIGGMSFYLDNEKTKIEQEVKSENIESRIPDTVGEFQKMQDHVNEVPSDVETYKREQRNIAIGDTLLIQQIKLDSQQVNITKQLKVIDSFFVFAKNKKIQDSIKEITKQKSRDSRTKDINTQKAVTLLILEKLNDLTLPNENGN